MPSLLLSFAPGAVSVWVYAGFVALVLGFLALDLGVFNRRAHTPSMREALGWTGVWIGTALVFGVGVYFLYEGHVMGLGLRVPVVGSPGETVTLGGFEAFRLYLTAYLVEKSLSMDNLFVIATIFTSLAIPGAYQHRVLFWGIVGALVLRGVMIALGSVVIASFSWVVYVFGAMLIFAALKMIFAGHEIGDPSENRFVRLMSRVMPVSRELDGRRLVTRIGGTLHATPLLVALVVVELTDVLFAVDSIPAVYAITGDPFIVFTSNIMAILGLRSLYFCLASAITKFRYLKPALIAVLLFVGVKLCLAHTAWKIEPEVSLGVVLGLLLSGIAASLVSAVGGVGMARRRALDWRWARAAWRENRTLRRAVVLTAGSVVLLAGLIIAPLPGPGFTILGPLGIGMLASEFIWARRVANEAMARERHIRGRLDRFLVRFPRVYIIPVVGMFWVTAWLISEFTPLPTWAMWSLCVPVVTPLCYVLYRWHKAREARHRALHGEMERAARREDASGAV